MGKKLKYSILACAYGNHKQFSNFLWTAYCQDFTNYEVVVVDNATPGAQMQSVYDCCPRKVKKYVHYHSIKREEKRCRNIAQGINLAASRAEGKYLVVVADSNVLLSFNLLEQIDALIDENSVVLSAGCNDVKISPDGQHDTEYACLNAEHISNSNDVLLELMGWPCDPLQLRLIPGKHRYPPPHLTYDCYIVAMSKDNYFKLGGYDESCKEWGEYHQVFVEKATKALQSRRLQGIRVLHQFHRVYKNDPL